MGRFSEYLERVDDKFWEKYPEVYRLGILASVGTEDGKHFLVSVRGLPANPRLEVLFEVPDDVRCAIFYKNRLYIGTKSAGIYEYPDGKKVFKGEYWNQFFINKNKLFAIDRYGGIFKIGDDGAEWEENLRTKTWMSYFRWLFTDDSGGIYLHYTDKKTIKAFISEVDTEYREKREILSMRCLKPYLLSQSEHLMQEYAITIASNRGIYVFDLENGEVVHVIWNKGKAVARFVIREARRNSWVFVAGDNKRGKLITGILWYREGFSSLSRKIPYRSLGLGYLTYFNPLLALEGDKEKLLRGGLDE